MRAALLISAITAVGVATAIADDAVTVTAPAKHTVYLYGADDLAKLEAANPDHYARARRIFAAADELCRPGPPQRQFVAAGGRDVSCNGALLRTSNPPKRQISFTLDDTRYIALVTVTDDRPRLLPIR